MSNVSDVEDDALLHDGAEIERVKEFIYLGQLMKWPPEKKRFNKELTRRITSGWNFFKKAKNLLISRRIPAHLKKQYIHQCVFPAMLYGAETWALTLAEEKRLGVAQRRMERRMLNVRLIERHSNDWLRERTQLDDLIQLSRKRKWNYLQKLMLFPNDRWNRILTEWVPDVTRNRDGQRRSARGRAFFFVTF